MSSLRPRYANETPTVTLVPGPGLPVTAAIDPGFTRIDGSRVHWVDRSAVAWFTGATLTRAAYWSDTKDLTADLVVIEKPTVYAVSRAGRGAPTVPPNDLVDLGWAGAMLAGRFRCPVVELLAERWKGSMAKPVCHMRMLQVLTADEAALLPDGSEARVRAAAQTLGLTGNCPPYKWKGVDVLDAVSLGLVYLGRLDLGGK